MLNKRALRESKRGNLRKKAQTAMEYVVVACVGVAALLAMKCWVKGALQGRYKEMANQIGPQYDPAFTFGQMDISYESLTNTTVSNKNISGEMKTVTETKIIKDYQERNITEDVRR